MSVSSIPVIYEDDSMLVLDKPAGINVHAGNGTKPGSTVEDSVRQYLGDSADQLERSGLVHRLDKDTSGLLLVAKTVDTFDYLKKLFKSRQIQKTYIAVVAGKLAPGQGIIDMPIGRDPIKRIKFRPAKDGRASTTEYKVTKYIGGFTLLEAYPKTGRTHQLRVHFAAIGHPIAGDMVYGKKASGLPRQFLHAGRLSFESMSGTALKFESPLAPDLAAWLDTVQ